MAANQQYDFLLHGKGYMLVRARSGAARSWKRYGVNVSPAGSSPDEGKFNAGPAEIRFAETFDDFSGGFGYAYRTAAPPNGIHWSENMDTRFAGQAVHCQAPLVATLPDAGGNAGGVNWLYDIPMANPVPPVGFAGVIALTNRYTDLAARGGAWLLFPKAGVFPAALDASYFADGTDGPFDGPPALFGSYLYVGGFGRALDPPVIYGKRFQRYDLDALNRTQGPIQGRKFTNAGNRLWAAVGPTAGPPLWMQSIAAGAEGLVIGDWSATIPVGNGHRPIQDVAALAGQVFCGLSDGLYAGDQTGTFVNVTGQLAGQSNPDNFRDLCVHDGQVVGQAVSGIYAYDPTSTTVTRVEQIGPFPRSNKSPVQGYPLSVESFGGWLYAGLWTGSQSWLMAGSKVGAEWRWNLMNRLPAAGRLGRLHFDGITAASGVPQVGLPNRLWMAMEGSYGAHSSAAAAPLYFYPVPRLNANPLAPDPVFSANYNGSARMVLPRSDRGAPGVLKMYEYAEVWADAFLSGSRYADVYYAIDGGARTLLGRAQASPVSRLYFTTSNPSFYSGRSLEWDVESYDATPGTCQVYRSIVGYGVMRPTTADVVDAVVHVGDNVPDRRGTPMRPGRNVIDELRSYADPNRLGGQVLTLIDLAGATQQVVLVPPIAESEFYQDGSRDPEIAASIRLAVLTYSGA